MTIQSTMTAMGYVAISATAAECRRCARSDETARGRLHCDRGGFLVAPIGSCKHFEARAAQPALPEPRKVQVGPTDI